MIGEEILGYWEDIGILQIRMCAFRIFTQYVSPFEKGSPESARGGIFLTHFSFDGNNERKLMNVTHNA